jgi:uncharacterized protein with HEPN domain
LSWTKGITQKKEARTLPDDVRVLAPDIPWSKIVGDAHILVHGNFDIDTDIVWLVATQDIPKLKAAVEQLLGRLTTG